MLEISFIVKILFSIYLAILIPVYWKKYGWQNFLWFSDIGMFITFFALWFNSSLLISMAVIGILPFELIWAVDYVVMLSGRRFLNITNYMFDSRYSKFLRALSLFHLIIPVIWIVCLIKWGYDVHAFWYQVLLTEATLIITFLASDPDKNINWVFVPIKKRWQVISSVTWLILLMIALPLFIIYPSHLLCSNL